MGNFKQIFNSEMAMEIVEETNQYTGRCGRVKHKPSWSPV